MLTSRLRLAAVAIIGSIGLAGCATYNPYGYGGVSVGYGSPYYGSGYGYGSPYYGYGSQYYGYGYQPSYYGWNNGYYYPGTGYYVYDRYRRPRVWSDTQRRYWSSRRQQATTSGVTAPKTPQWSGFERTSQQTDKQRAARRAERAARRDSRDQERSD